MHKITTLDQYKHLIKETLFEIQDLRASVEYDEEFMGGVQKFIAELEQGVKTLLEQVESGTYKFGEGKLAFMSIVESTSSELLPFKSMLNLIDSTHKSGLHK